MKLYISLVTKRGSLISGTAQLTKKEFIPICFRAAYRWARSDFERFLEAKLMSDSGCVLKRFNAYDLAYYSDSVKGR